MSVFDKHTLVPLFLGASDDAVSCAVMLEVLHSLANQSTPLLHGVVFLFNGAEENILQVNGSFTLLVCTVILFLTLHFLISTVAFLLCLFVLMLLPIRPVTVSLLSIRGPSRCEPLLTWRLQVLAARRLFFRQVLYPKGMFSFILLFLVSSACLFCTCNAFSF